MGSANQRQNDVFFAFFLSCFTLFLFKKKAKVTSFVFCHATTGLTIIIFRPFFAFSVLINARAKRWLINQ